MDSFITTFHIDWKIIIAQVINFAIVFGVFYAFALKPLKKLMQERSDRIAKGLDDAKCNAEVLMTTQDEYKKIVAKAREEAHVIFQDGKKEAEAKKQEMLDAAKADVENMIATGKKTLEAEKAKMVEEAKKEIVSIVVLATEKLLSDQVDKTFDEKQIKHIKKA
jgi:F-type H+-transporting ATPase subunit b